MRPPESLGHTATGPTPPPSEQATNPTPSTKSHRICPRDSPPRRRVLSAVSAPHQRSTSSAWSAASSRRTPPMDKVGGGERPGERAARRQRGVPGEVVAQREAHRASNGAPPARHGFARVYREPMISRTPSRERCQELPGRRLGCGHDRLVAFSCKRRGGCSSCGGRRMNYLSPGRPRDAGEDRRGEDAAHARLRPRRDLRAERARVRELDLRARRPEVATPPTATARCRRLHSSASPSVGRGGRRPRG